MEDVDGPLIAQSVYKDIFDGDSEYIDPDDIAYALDTAVRQLRIPIPADGRRTFISGYNQASILVADGTGM
jgi:hypothetical protein